jgi:lipoate-protein ligase A
MAKRFADILGVDLVPGELTEAEKAMLAEELPKFQSDEWIYGLRTPQQDKELSRAEHKCTGGLIRVSLRLDHTRKVIKSAFITGDFFAYPERSILDLEAALKNTSFDLEKVKKVVNTFFNTREVKFQG